jgi:hypothetical protein
MQIPVKPLLRLINPFVIVSLHPGSPSDMLLSNYPEKHED